MDAGDVRSGRGSQGLEARLKEGVAFAPHRRGRYRVVQIARSGLSVANERAASSVHGSPQVSRINYGLAAAAISFLLVFVDHLAVGATDADSRLSTAAIEQFVTAERARACRGMEIHASASGIQEVKTDGVAGAEYVVQPRDNCLCSPTGNCKAWVLVPDKDGIRVLLTASRAQKIEVLSMSRHGRPDIETSAHDSATESTHWIYRFDGTKYQRSSCARWSYSDRNDPDRVLDNPRISRCMG